MERDRLDERQAADPLGTVGGGSQGDRSTIGMADDMRRFAQSIEHRMNKPRLVGKQHRSAMAPLRGLAIAIQVDQDRAVAHVERVGDLAPLVSGTRRSMQKDHRLATLAIDVLERGNSSFQIAMHMAEMREEMQR